MVEVRLRPEWLPSQGDASDSDVLLRQLLAADLRDACEGSLPRNLERQHNIHVEGTLVLESQSGGIFGYFILFYQVQDGCNCKFILIVYSSILVSHDERDGTTATLESEFLGHLTGPRSVKIIG